MARGGARPGAGKPKGSTNRPVLRSYFTPKEIEEYVEDLKQSAKDDSNLKKFVGEQIFGKAVQPIGGDDEKPLQLQITGMKIVKE